MPSIKHILLLWYAMAQNSHTSDLQAQKEVTVDEDAHMH